MDMVEESSFCGCVAVMKMSSHKKILTGFALVMGAAAVLAVTSLACLYLLEKQVAQIEVTAKSLDDARAGLLGLKASIGRGYWFVIGVGAIGTVVSCACIGWIWLTLGRVLREVGTQLEDSSRQVWDSSADLSAHSEVLAENASGTAANIEENNASIDKLAGTTLQMSGNAEKSKLLAQDARSAADVGSADMKALATTMGEIQKANDDVARIVKVIDEIAFQTNLLALNAAVEAARAGEAGLGFAVVADEVRSLAQRSASSARETSEHVAAALQKTRHGVDLTEKVSSGLKRIVESNQKLDALVAEVASASGEQRQGIDLLRGSAEQMDHMTQDTAANAEEVAGSAKVLREHAGKLRQAVSVLRELVESGGARTAADTRENFESERPANVRERAKLNV